MEEGKTVSWRVRYGSAAKSVSDPKGTTIMERWVNKITNLEQKKRHYEEILRRELSGLDEEFESLRFLSQELSLRARNIRLRKAA